MKIYGGSLVTRAYLGSYEQLLRQRDTGIKVLVGGMSAQERWHISLWKRESLSKVMT